MNCSTFDLMKKCATYELEQLRSDYSDLHKSMYGVRFVPMYETIEDLEVSYKFLCESSQDLFEEEEHHTAVTKELLAFEERMMGEDAPNYGEFWRILI